MLKGEERFWRITNRVVLILVLLVIGWVVLVLSIGTDPLGILNSL